MSAPEQGFTFVDFIEFLLLFIYRIVVVSHHWILYYGLYFYTFIGFFICFIYVLDIRTSVFIMISCFNVIYIYYIYIYIIYIYIGFYI